MLALHNAAAGGDRRAAHLFNPQPIQGQTGPHDVHNRIDGPDLVEVDLLNGRAVRLGLRLRQPGEHGHRPLTHGLGQTAVFDDLANVLQVPVRLLGRCLDANLKLRGRESLLAGPLGIQRVPSYPQVAQIAPQSIQVQTGIQQRTEDHVPAGPAETVEISDPHVSIHAPAQRATIQERHRIIVPGTLPERPATSLGPLPMPHGVYAHGTPSATTSEDIGRQSYPSTAIALPSAGGIIRRYGITRASSAQPLRRAVRRRNHLLRLLSLRVLTRGRRCPIFRVCRYPAAREISPKRVPRRLARRPNATVNRRQPTYNRKT
jgi:hypothetical protein